MVPSLRFVGVAALLLTLTSPRPAPGQLEEPPTTAVVFAPGTVSVEGGNVFRGAFSPDGREFWFFRKVTEGEEDYRIFVSRRTEEAGWGQPEKVLLGGEYSELYPSISPDGGRMVFASYRPIPGDTSDHPNAHLWYVDRNPDGSWGTPVFMSAPSTLANYDNNPRFRPDGSIEFGSTTPDWSTNTRHVTRWAGTRYVPAEPDTTLNAWSEWSDDVVVSHVTLSPDGALAIFDVRHRNEEGLGTSDLWFSRLEDGDWSDPEPLEGGVNTPEDFENFAVFTPDGRELLFVRGFHLYWRIGTDAATGR